MPPTEPTPADLAQWKALCEVVAIAFKSSQGGGNLEELVVIALPALLAAYERVVEERDAARRMGWEIVWRICDTLNLGAGGCPDSLIIDEVTRLRADRDRLTARVRELKLGLEYAQGRVRELEQERAALRAQVEKWKLTYDDAYIADWKRRHGIKDAP